MIRPRTAESRVLGFDARERWCPRDMLWPDARIQRYLLRSDVEKPLSADVMVWPTVFADPQLRWIEPAALQLGSHGLPRPAFTGYVQDLWNQLPELQRNLPARLGPHTFVAVTSEDDRYQNLPACSPDSLSHDWQLAGYDVVDPWLLSGLANCGYHEDDIVALRSRWGPVLNRHHLFDQAADAAAFAREADTRVREHAPFSPCGVWIRGDP